MNKISLFLLMSFTSTVVIAQGQQQNCNDLPQGDQRELCIYRQMSNGGPGQQQQALRMSDEVRDCNATFGRPEPQQQTPSGPTVRRRTVTETVNGVTTTRVIEESDEEVRSGPTPPPAGMRPSTGLTQIWQELNAPPVPAPQTPAPPVMVILPDAAAKAQRCRALQMTAAGVGAPFGATERKVAMDGRIYCQQLAGYTADYQSCLRALNMYNNVRMAESALFIMQSAQANNNQQQAQNSALQRTAAGDGQNAAYDAQISMASKASELNQQKAMAYAAAVAALGSTIASWIKQESLPQTLCSGNPGQSLRPSSGEQNLQSEGFVKTDAVGAPQCPRSVQIALDVAPGEVIANEQAKAGFKAALVELVAKGIQAGIAARQLGEVAKKVEEARDSTEDPYNPATFEYCKVSPNDPRCITSNGRTPGSGLQDGGFSLGDGFGVNAFNPLGDPEDMTNGEQAPLPGDDRVADTNNPFIDDAKKADGILDPAAAANVQPGGGAGGGGGGGGGLPGGGSASLGNDVPGVDETKKENDIKANKADGKYNIAGGGSFQAVKPMKEENPFANLFGGKGGGGLQEDRGPASGDIDGKDSGLFAKISKRYSQVQADKRIEAKNLEE